MDDALALRVSTQERFQELRRKRSRFGWSLTAAMLVVYYGFIVLVAFNKPLLATRLGEGVTTVGMPVGLGVIVFTVLITVIYVRRANAEFDTLNAQVVEGARS
jgi:uncharacterized membrane protein (DUF485 family)